MSTKKTIIKKLVAVKRNAVRVKDMLSMKAGKIYTCDDIQEMKLFHINKKNVFFGYYDLNQFDTTGTKLLAHITDRNANPAIDPAKIAWIDYNTSEFHYLGETKAWSWQQGSRLRWHPVLPDTILYNNVEDGKYVLNQMNIKTKETNVISEALYDIDPAFDYGIKVNFERLQRLRPGYGYNCFGDNTVSLSRPENDGVFKVNLKTGKEEILFSLKELADGISDDGCHHYINHVSYSPSGKQFLFFHLWTRGASLPWNMRFYVCNSDGSNLRMLEDNIRISHYHWIDENQIIATRAVSGKKYEYVIYDVKLLTKTVVANDLLCVDGHPNIFSEGFVTDTYPQKDSMQHMYYFSPDAKECNEIARVYSNPVCYGEHRCDLHPRVHDNSLISIDCTVKHDVRSIVCFKF